ncbi:sugar phosphate permease [Sphingomonas vulcanisoli]|uniref:Sugar phosphate permease n=1 Tax=Sphingomonas vulcanisoli TaxID=1658060 RepID=A0ABX0TVQ3_9SPHN|nr:MFS transporter [Sphingomonas vulcanisoli]NIJ09616.1 sugar phosphate permease [Sphingomonas vulcanisoli]
MTPNRPYNAADSAAGPRNGAVRSLIAGCIGMAMGASPVLLLSFGVYQRAIIRDTGWDPGTVGSAIAGPMILAGLLSPLVGMLVNRYGPRRFVTISFPLGGLAIMLLATPKSAGMFVATMGLVGVLGVGQTMTPYVYAVSGWFDRRRGLALGTILACTGVGLAIMPPLAAQIIAHYGWRTSYLAFGAAMVVVGFAVGRFLIVDPPVAAVADRSSVPGVPWRAALASPVLWYLTVSIMLVGGAVGAGAVNLSLILVERGVTPERASFVMSLVGISMILARLMFGYLFDRMRPKLLTTVICVMTGLAFVILSTTTGSVGVLVGAVLIGIGFGAEGDAMSYMISRAFGMRDFGTIFGIMFLAFTFGGGFGPITFALLHARTGSFELPLIIAAGACAVAIVLVLMIRDSDLPFGRHEAVEPIEREPLPLAAE